VLLDRLAEWEDFRRWHAVVVVFGINASGNAELSEIIQTNCVMGFGLGAAERGQEQACEEGNDCDDDEQFDQCKSPSSIFL